MGAGAILGAATGAVSIPVLVLIGSASAGGYSAMKIWRNARQAYSKGRWKGFDLKLDKSKGLHTARGANISSKMVNDVRYYIQKGSVGKLTDQFNWVVKRQLELNTALAGARIRRLRSCAEAAELANLLYRVERRREKLVNESEKFLDFCCWIENEMDRCAIVLFPEKVGHILRQIRHVTSDPSKAAHERCRKKGCCYRLRSSGFNKGKIFDPARPTKRFHGALWKNHPYSRLMNDAMNLAYGMSPYRDFRDEFQRIFRDAESDIHIFMTAENFPRRERYKRDSSDILNSTYATTHLKEHAKAGLGTGVKFGLFGAGEVTGGVLKGVIQSIAPSSLVSGLAGGAATGAGAVVTGGIRSLSDLYVNQTHWKRINRNAEISGFTANKLLEFKSRRLDSLRTLMKGGQFESGVDHFIKLRKEVKTLEKLVGIGENGQKEIDNCERAVTAARAMISAVKHWQAMERSLFLMKEYKDIMMAEAKIHCDFPAEERKVLDAIERWVRNHGLMYGESDCCNNCVYTAVLAEENEE